VLLLGAIVALVLVLLRLPLDVWGSFALAWLALWRAWDWLKIWAVKKMETP
jgi:hypothetical protein